MSDDDRATRESCDELARLLDEPSGFRMARLLRATGALGPRRAEPSRRAAEHWAHFLLERARANPVPIAIWKPSVGEDGQAVFLRDDDALEAPLYGPQRTLRAKQSSLPLRVCWLGESTAAGWLYAPDWTPAGLLGEELSRTCGRGTCEVVDLSAIDLTGPALIELMASAVQLEPDVFVVLAGNNWAPLIGQHPDVQLSDSQAAARALRGGGVRALSEMVERRTAELAHSYVAAMAEIARESKTQLIFVVPEVNLADWDWSHPVRWLDGDRTVRWYELLARARAALLGDDAAEAAELALQMTDLDQATCGASFSLLGLARAKQERWDEAYQAFRAAVRARACDNVPAVPCAPVAVQDALRAAAEHDVVVVDLPELFRKRSGGRPPGRELFLDYCHLTCEGTGLLVNAVVASIVERCQPGGCNAEAAAGASEAPASVPPRSAEARSAFASALYALHSGVLRSKTRDVADPRPLSRYWLERTLETGNEGLVLCASYLQARSVPAWVARFSQGTQELAERVGRTGARAALHVCLDPEGVTQIAELLADAEPALGADALRSVVHHYGVGAEPRELTDPTYCYSPSDAAHARGAFGRAREALYRARWPVSAFCLVSDAKRDIEIELTARLRTPGTASALRVHVNGHALEAVSVNAAWTVATVAIPRSLQRAGLNELTLEWPLPEASGTAVLVATAERLELGHPVDLHPVFGELFSLQARALGEVTHDV